MKIVIKYLDKKVEFDNKTTITIGNSSSCDFVIDEINDETTIKLIYTQKYNSYVLVNSNNSKNVLFNNNNFSKVLIPAKFAVNIAELPDAIYFETETSQKSNTLQRKEQTKVEVVNKTAAKAAAYSVNSNKNDIFNNNIETNRIAIIKEIGYKITELKDSIRSLTVTSFILNTATIILSLVCAFGMTNFLLGLKVDSSSSVLNLTTNVGFLVCISTIVFAIAMILKQGVFSLLDFNQNKKYGDSDIAQKAIIFIASIFMLIVYAINLFYYKAIPGFQTAAFFVSLLFAGALAVVAVGGGYFKFQTKKYNHQLTNCEYREDFETVMKSYRNLIPTFVNNLSQNRLNTVKNNLLNCQFRMIIEVFIGLLTAPFLAYGVSNTLASCFPEAANWVRISGLRFSPIFLVLATFLIIFAFFSFVRGFTISKQIKGSEIIKFDGFHDYNSHGVTVLGLDSIHSLKKEKNIVMFIACFIILIEFTMNVSYFITEIGADIQGMFLSFVTALVPTALLIAETHLLSSTMYKINNYNELLSMLD